MANICNNIMKVYFNDKDGVENYIKNNTIAFIKQFKEDFGSIDYLYPKIQDENDIRDDFEGNLEIQFDSRWSTPTEKLEEYSLKFDCTFLGVSYEWGNGYVNSFEIDETISHEFDLELKDVTMDQQMIDLGYESIGQVINDDPTADPRLWKWQKGNEIVITHDDGNSYCHVVNLIKKEV